ncbi:MAG: winged helix-turn-helix domain-containing protein [Brucellaceae bacterium]|nr:winged helix-turn-helix domain-containing protein [Brucellaceae bacterium]
MSRKEDEEIPKPSENVRIGRSVFNRAMGELVGPRNEPVRLRPQSASVLAMLAEKPGKVISKTDLMDAVWPDTHVTEDSLVQCITDIRRAVGAEGRDAIETVPKRGYRLKPTIPRPSTAARRHLVLVAGVVAALLVLVAAATVFWLRQDAAEIANVDRKGIAVLPFVNMSSDPEQEYFSDGITVDLTTDLSKVSGLLVAAQSAAFSYKGSEAPLGEIAAELGVDYVIEGSVRKDGPRLRINTQLVNAGTGNQVWAERYDRSVTDVFALQEEVVRKIVAALSVKLDGEEKARLSSAARVNPNAYDLLLRGLSAYRQFTITDNLEARSYFERAIAIDPDFARAYAELARTYTSEIQLDWVRDPRANAFTALTLAEKALSLDAENPYVYFALSIIYRTMGKHEPAIDAARKSIEINPNFADGYATLALDLNYAGRPEEGLDNIDKALRLNTEPPYFYIWIKGHSHYLLGRYERAAELLEKTRLQNAEFIPAHKLLAATLVELGKIDEAEWEVAEIETRLPAFSLSQERANSPYKMDDVFDRYIENLRKAGLK